MARKEYTATEDGSPDGETRRPAGRVILYSSRKGENLLDLFGGSGSTHIACEQTGRRAFLMQIDDLYCDVIVQRWEEFTGQKAECVGKEDAT